jgi:hypothetical protein
MVMVAAWQDSGSEAGTWVEAAPFRAHLRHLMSVSGLGSSSLALLVGVSPRCAHRLLHGRDGRPLKRISPEVARKLLLLTPSDARAVQRCTVPASATVRHLRRLQQAGWSEPDLASALGLSHADLIALLTGVSSSCSQLVALRAAAEVSELLTPMPDHSTPDQAAA